MTRDDLSLLATIIGIIAGALSIFFSARRLYQEAVEEEPTPMV